MAMDSRAAHVAALVEVGGEREFPLGEATTIGRDADSAIPLSDRMVARRHAEVRRTVEGRYLLVDLGSRHGTFVGGKRVTEQLLEDGDEVLIAGVRLRFEARSAPPARAGATAAATAAAGKAGAPPLKLERGGPAPRVHRRLPVDSARRFVPARDIVAQDELARDYEKLRAALVLSRTIGVEHDVDILLDRILTAAFELLPAERAAIMLLDAGSGEPYAQITRTRDGGRESMTLSTSLIHEVFSTRTGVITADALLDDRFQRSMSIASEGIRSAMCVPMLYSLGGLGGRSESSKRSDETLGVIYLDSRLMANAFSEQDLELLTIIATQAALAVKNALLVQRVHQVKAAEWERLERLMRHLPTGVILLDGERRIALVNSQAEELLPLIGPARVGDVLERIGALSAEEALAQGALQELDLTLPGPPRRVVALSTAQLSGETDSEAVLTLRDITDERERELRAAREERLALLGRLAGGIAHDFNNLLAVILSYTELARDTVGPESQLYEDLAQVHEAADRAAALTRQLLAFGRRELAKPRVIDLNKHVADIDRLLRRTIPVTIEVKSRLGSNVPTVEIDPAQFEQVVANLVVNARDAMPSGGTIAIETTAVDIDEEEAARHHGMAPGIYAALSVTDTGVGMSPEVLARAFEPFFTTKEREQGTGLGLATVYGVVRRAHGTILVESEPGKGSVFRVLLPAANAPVWVPAAAPRPATGPRGETLLVAEDQASVRRSTARILERQGYHVLTAKSGEDALSVAESSNEPIDLVITDVVMPGMSGWELASRVREVRPGIRVVFVSGNLGAPGADPLPRGDFLLKPFSANELLEMVRRVLDTAPAS